MFFNKEVFELNPSSADNMPLYSVPLYMNHGVNNLLHSSWKSSFVEMKTISQNYTRRSEIPMYQIKAEFLSLN